MSKYYDNRVKSDGKLNISSIYGIQMSLGDNINTGMKNVKLKDKYDYYITLTELFYRIKKSSSSQNDTKKTIRFNTNLIRAKKGRPLEEEKHELRVKYIMCIVDSNFTFSKLDKRRVKKEYVDKKGNTIAYFIPINFIRSLLPEKISRSENISIELEEIPIFKYTGKIEMLETTNIFSLSKEIYLTDKVDVESAKIKIIF